LYQQEPNILLEEFFTLFSRIPMPAENTPFSQEALETAILQLKASLPVEELQYKVSVLQEVFDLLSPAKVVHKPVSAPEKRILKINTYIEENYRKDIRLSDIARHIGLSKEALCSFYKKHTSRTITSYLNEIRIETSAQMLRETDDLISWIAYSCGFNTIYYFNKTFKQSKGMTPAKYREMIQSEP
jgi:AraC-like DNA-binding protein